MSDRVQIGPNIDRDLWERFRKDVQERKGQVRGVLGDELENALRQYLSENNELDSDERLRRIENRLARMEDNQGLVPADGGDPDSSDEHTHAPSRIDAATDEKPAANTATEKKVAYLAEELLNREVPNSRELTSVPKKDIRELVKEEYGFRKDTAKRYVEAVAEHLSLRNHPTADGILVDDDRHAELISEQRDQHRQEAEEKL